MISGVYRSAPNPQALSLLSRSSPGLECILVLQLLNLLEQVHPSSKVEQVSRDNVILTHTMKENPYIHCKALFQQLLRALFYAEQSPLSPLRQQRTTVFSIGCSHGHTCPGLLAIYSEDTSILSLFLVSLLGVEGNTVLVPILPTTM